MEGGAAVWRCEGGGPPAAGVRACEGGTPTPGVGGVWVGLRLGSRNLQVPVLVQHNENSFTQTDVCGVAPGGHGRERPPLGFGNPLHTCTHSWGLETHSTHVPTPGVWKPTPHVYPLLGFGYPLHTCTHSWGLETHSTHVPTPGVWIPTPHVSGGGVGGVWVGLRLGSRNLPN